MKKSLHIIYTLLLALVTMASLTACSKDSGENEPKVNIVENASFKISIHTTATPAQTRGENPSAADGYWGADEREYKVTNATLFFYQSKRGINASESTPLLFKIYIATFARDNAAASSPVDVCYTSEVVNTHFSISEGEYHVVAVCNLGDLRDEATTLGDLQQLTTSHILAGTSTDVASCTDFAMSSSDDAAVTINAVTNMPDEPDGALTEMSINVQRMAARIDYSPGTGTWIPNKTIPTTEGDITRGCYEYVVEDAPNDRFYLTSVTPINLGNNTEYVLKRVTGDKTFNTITYLGSELIGADNNAANYVVDPFTKEKTLGTDVLLNYINPYATWIDDFDANNEQYPVSEVADGLDYCYTDNSLAYKKLCYAKENTIPQGATKTKYVTGLVFTGYYLKEGTTTAVKKTYVYFIRHTDPSGSASDGIAMKYGIVRNHLYQINVSKVASLGIIVLEVRDWTPLVAPDIDL